MADFSSRISEIRSDLDTLLSTLTRMDQELKTASSDFESLAANAKEISTLSTAIQRLSKFLGQENSPLLDSLKSRVTEINTELQGLNLTQLKNANEALDANAKAVAAISRAQANLNRQTVNILSSLGSVRAELDNLERASSQTGRGFEESVARIVQSMSQLNQLTNVGAPIEALNQLNPDKYNQAATALQKIHDVVAALKNANITIDVSAASEADKLVHKPIQPVIKQPVAETEVPVQRPTKVVQTAPTVVKFAQENGIDLSQLQGTGARGRITKEDVLKARQAAPTPVNLPTVDVNDKDQLVKRAQEKLERDQRALLKLNEAINRVEQKSLEVLKTTFKEYDIKTTGQQEVAREYLIPDPKARPDQRRRAERDFNDSFKTPGIIEADFRSNLAGTKPIETGLPIGAVQAADAAAIAKLYLLRAQVEKEIEQLSKALNQPAELTIGHLVNGLLKHKDITTPDEIQPTAENVIHNPKTGTYSTRGNGIVGANAAEASANLASIFLAVEDSVHKVALISSTGANAGGSSLIPGQGRSDHVALAYKDAEGVIRILELLGDVAKLSPGNKLGNAAGGLLAPERRSAEKFSADVDRVEAIPINFGTREEIDSLLASQIRLTEPGKAVYSPANELRKNDLVDIGHTCASATAEAFKESGLLTDIAEKGTFGKVPGLTGLNVVTPNDVINRVERANAGKFGPGSLSETVVEKLNDKILGLSGRGISYQYKINADRGIGDGPYTGNIVDTTPGTVQRNPYTGKYNSVGDKVVGSNAEKTAATREAVLSAIADSQHGIALVGVSGRSANGQSASTFDALDRNNAADHAAIVALEGDVIKVYELLNDGSIAKKGRTLTGAQASTGTSPGADSFDDFIRTWNYAQAVPINAANPEQAKDLIENLKENTRTGADYGLQKIIDPETGRLIGESCATAIAKSGRDAGIFPQGYGEANQAGQNTLQPSHLLRLAQAQNEEYLRTVASQGDGTIEAQKQEAEVALEHVTKAFDEVDGDYSRLVAARRQLLEEVIADDDALRQRIEEDLTKLQVGHDLPTFIKNIAEGNYRSQTIGPEKDSLAIANGNGLFGDLENAGLGEGVFAPVQSDRANFQDLRDLQRAKVRSLAGRENQLQALRETGPTTSVDFEVGLAATVGDIRGKYQVAKTDVEALQKKIAAQIARFFAAIKDTFSGISSSIGNIIGSAKDISIGDIVNEVKAFFTAKPQQQQEAPAELSIKAVRQNLAQFSRDYYRPFQTGTTYFGAGLNSLQLITKGLQNGGVGGALDVGGGVIKGLNTVANANAQLGLNILPKGIGEVFTNDRSSTLLDIFETIVKGSTGYGRGSIDRNFTRLKAEEEPLVREKEKLQEARESGSLSPEELARAEYELAEVTRKLKELRQSIAAYQRVLAEEAKNAGGSTGATLSEEALKDQTTTKTRTKKTKTEQPAPEPPPETSIVSPFHQILSEEERLLSRQAKASLERFSAGTGLEHTLAGGVTVARSDNFRKIIESEYSRDALRGIDPGTVAGIAYKSGKGIGVNPEIGNNPAQSAVHETVHTIINQGDARRLYDPNNDFAYKNAETARLQAEKGPIHQGVVERRREGIQDPEARGILDQYFSSSAHKQYYDRPNEQYAHVGEALISGNKDLEVALQTIYGKRLYDSLVNDLKREIPDTFGEEALPILRARYKAFEAEFNRAVSGGTESPAELSARPTAAPPQDIIKDIRSAFTDVFASDVQQLQKQAQGLKQDLPEYGQILQQVLTPGNRSFDNIAKTAGDLYIPEGTAGRRLIQSTEAAGGTLTADLKRAILEPTRESFTKLFQSAKNVDIQEILKDYARRVFTEGGLDIKGGLGALAATRGGTANNTELLASFATQFKDRSVTFRNELNDRVRGLTGRNIEIGSYSQQATIDPATGLQKYTVSARTADGATISLNAHLDEFGRKKLEEPERAVSRLGESLKQVSIGALRQIGDQFTYGLVNAFQEMGRQLVGIQDELSEVANLLGVVGDKATRAKSEFLFNSVGTAVKTGQGFDEAIQTNLKNFKILGSVKDTDKRSELANQISEVQLGAQTAFGISLEQSLESIPAILATIKDGLDDIPDPADKVTEALKQLKGVTDDIVVAQRSTGAQADDLIVTYSRLAESAKQYGLNSKQLLAFVATSSVAIGKGPDENSNIARSFLEGTYSEANQAQFAKSGIATKSFNTKTNQVENRSFEDILNDLYKLSKNDAKSVEYNQLLQSIAGPKLKPDIAKAIAGFGSGYQQVYTAEQGAQPGTFERLVAQKSENFQGSANKLQATGTQLLGSALVGTGALDDMTKILDRLSEAAVKLTRFLNDNQDAIKGIVDRVKPFIALFVSGGLTKGLNIFAPLASGITAFQNTLEGAKAKLIDIERVGDTAMTPLTKNLTLALAILKEMGEVAGGTAAELKLGFDKASAGVDTLITKEQELAELKTINNGGTPAPASTNVQRGIQNAQTVVEAVNAPSRLDRIKGALEKPGAIAGALVGPVAFDAIAGGFGKDNLTNIGVGIAGGIAGGIVGGPYGSIIGYGIAKSISEGLDVAGIFGTSEKESDSFSQALKNALYGKPVEQQEQDRKQSIEAAKTDLAGLSDKLGLSKLEAAYSRAEEDHYNGKAGAGALYTSAADVKSYLAFQTQNGRAPTFFDNYKLNNQGVENTLNLFGGNKELTNLFAESGVSNVKEFIDLIKQASQGLGPLAEKFAELNVQQKGQLTQVDAQTKNQDLQALYESGQQAIERTNTDLQNVTEANTQRYATPLGLDTYSPFGDKYKQLESGYNATLDRIKAGTLSGQPAQDALARYDKAFAAMEQLPSTLQQLIPFAQAQGLNTTGLEQKLYNTGAEGQQRLVQRFQPAIQADSFVREYEQRQKNVTALRNTAGFKTGTDDAVIKQVAALEKALGIDKARYSISIALLAAFKGQTDILLNQADAIEKQTQTRQLISAGTPAQFTPANIFDTKGLSSNQLNSAIEYALKKQSRLEALNPNYRKEFAKDQFLLQSGSDFKGVTGVNQGFVQEYLQQQQQKSQAPLEDLSKFSDQEIGKILDQARALQSQAEKLDPTRAGKYENDRILILKKNNDLLAQTGLGQEFLKLAIQENTKASDQLRGHFNLPSNYKAPTVFDYYASGGTEKGDKNFPTLASQGLVPLSFAQQLAQQLVAGNASDKGADLSSITGTNQPGARPLFYPNPGTGAVYSEAEPLILPDSIKQDKKISDAVQRFYDFKQRQIEDFDNAVAHGGGGTGTNDKNAYANAVKAPIIPPNGPRRRDNGFYGTKPTSVSDLEGAGAPGTLQHQAFKDATVNLDAFNGALKDGKAETSGLITPLRQSAEAGKTFASSVSPIPTAMTSLNTGATTFAQTITQFATKLGNFDLADAIKRSNIQIQVTVNGQTTTADQVVITNSAPTGTSTLSAGPANRSGSKAGDNRR